MILQQPLKRNNNIYEEYKHVTYDTNKTY